MNLEKSRKKGTGDGPSKGKGSNKPSEEQLPFVPPALPSLSATNPPWMPTSTHAGAMPSAPSAAAPLDSKEDTEKDRQMRSLVAALRKHKDELPQDIQSKPS